jgi:outer membrane PBP1 activator LpoA protein
MLEIKRMTARTRTCALALAAAWVVAGCATPPWQGEQGNRAPSQGYGGDQTVAVLLPESGRFAGAAQAVRDGILAAQAADPQGARPRLVFRDTSGTTSAPALVKEAAAQGAGLVIGPLEREQVDQLAVQPNLPVPVLALNRSTGGTAAPGNLYQFALAPEDEAAAAAEKAFEAGHRAALLLYPASAWGERVAAGFRSRWGELGGLIPASQAYDPGAYDKGPAVSDVLSAGRAAPVAPDMVFLVATAHAAAEIWPLVQRDSGGLLPGFATSHVHRVEGPDSPALAGLQYVDIPWLAAPSAEDPVSFARLQAGNPAFESRYARLYAMGIDAYRLAPRLGELAARPSATVAGATGTLSLDRRRHVVRRLVLARIEAPPATAHAGPGGEPLRLAARWPSDGTHGADRP